MKDKYPIDPERLKRFLNPDTHLIAGAGKGANGTIDVCIMQAVDWLRGGDGKTDAPPCVSRSIKNFCIRLNDSYLFKDHRDLLKPFAVNIVGTADDGKENRRGFIAANFACRIAAPIWFEALGYPKWAKQCKKLEPITNKVTAEAGNKLLREIEAHAAYAAAAAANAAAYAAYAAAYAAYAAAAAYAVGGGGGVGDVRQIVDGPHGEKLRKKCLKCLSDLIIAKGE